MADIRLKFYPDDPLDPCVFRMLGHDIPAEHVDEYDQWTLDYLRQHYAKLGKPCPYDKEPA